jgi:hypothetical protein
MPGALRRGGHKRYGNVPAQRLQQKHRTTSAKAHGALVERLLLLGSGS